MTALEINLNGTSVIARHAERAVLSVKVCSEGPSQETVSNDVTSTSNSLAKRFKELAPQSKDGNATPDAPVTIFSMTSMRTSSWIPTVYRNKENVQLPRQYQAITMFKVIFRNFNKLGEITGTLFKTFHTTIEGTEYVLTDQTKEELGSESRKAALRDAIRKAQDYAEVVGKKVVAVEISEQSHSVGMRLKQMARRSDAATSVSFVDGLTVEPEDVELRSSVGVKFVAE